MQVPIRARLARQIVEYLRGLMLIQMGNANQVEATADVKKQMQSHARSFSTSDVLRMMKAFNNAATDLRGGWQPSLSLELALAEVLDAPNEPAPRTSCAASAATASACRRCPSACSCFTNGIHLIKLRAGVKESSGTKDGLRATVGSRSTTSSSRKVSRQRRRCYQSLEAFVCVPSKSTGESLCVVELGQDDRHAGQDVDPGSGE